MPECIPLYSCTLLSGDENHKYTYERTSFAGRQCTDCPTLQRRSRVLFDAFATASLKFGLKINIKKKEVMCRPNFTAAREDAINVDNTTLYPVQEFTYLGNIIIIIINNNNIIIIIIMYFYSASIQFTCSRELFMNNFKK